ncbi:hypothetical protein ABW51_06485 [Haemophilus sp. C1]|nr:hypothetical protein ABW51_06485 [Haemophilus sp. C1]
MLGIDLTTAYLLKGKGAILTVGEIQQKGQLILMSPINLYSMVQSLAVLVLLLVTVWGKPLKYG